MNVNKIKGLLLGFLATFCWASFYIVSRYFFGTDDDGLDPLWSSCLRYLLASLVLFVCLIALKQIPAWGTALRKDWKMLLLLGLAGLLPSLLLPSRLQGELPLLLPSRLRGVLPLLPQLLQERLLSSWLRRS